jgi:uracil-DNA glycosylase
MLTHLPKSWQSHFKAEMSQDYFQKLMNFLTEHQKNHVILPHQYLWFQTFNLCCFNDISVVILGQDPYHDIGQAHGLAFSVQDNVKIPPSLKNIFKELEGDLNIPTPNSGNLTGWSKQGVLLLNTSLTVQAHTAGSHSNQGWEIFTDRVIEKISEEKQNCVFLLWGSHAQKKIPLIDPDKHLILQAPHPSPLSAYRGFFGCRHFSKTNDYLKEHNKREIVWDL